MPNSEEDFQSYGIRTDSVIYLNGFHDKSLLEFFLSFMAKCVSPCMPSLLKARGCSTLSLSITVLLPSPPSRLPLSLPTRIAAKITNYPRASMYVYMCSVMSLCSLINCSPPDSSVHGILQARILERVAISSSRGSSRPRDGTQVSCIAGRFFTTMPPGKPGPPVGSGDGCTPKK